MFRLLSSQTLKISRGEQEDGIAPSFGGQWVPRLVHLGQPHGALERQVHDAVHGLIGGSTRLMVKPETAAQDPMIMRQIIVG